MIIIVSIFSLLYITNDVIYGNFKDTPCTMLYRQSVPGRSTAQLAFPLVFIWSPVQLTDLVHSLQPLSSSKHSQGTDPLTCR